MKITILKILSMLLVVSLLTAALNGCQVGDASGTSTADAHSAVTSASSSADSDSSAGSWTILGTYWQNSETGEVILLNEDYTAVWANQMGGEAQYGRFEWNVDNNRGRLYIEDWDVIMEITGQGLRLFNEVRNDVVDQLEKLPDDFRLDEKDPYAPNPSPSDEEDALTDTYWGFMTAYYVFCRGGVVKVGNDMTYDWKTGTYKLGSDGKGTITVDRKETSFTYKDGKLKINTPWGYHDASAMKKEFFDTYFPDI